MKTITTMLVFIAFIYIVLNKRFKVKKAASKDKEPVLHPDKSVSSSPSYPDNVPIIPLSGLDRDRSYRYDVMVFDYTESENGSYFADRIDAKLSLLVSEMLDKDYQYRLDFITIGTSLLVLVTYRIDSRDDTNVHSSSGSEA